MNTLCLELAERIRGEIPELERVAQRALAAWAKAKQMPEESAYLDSVALNLHGFYSGLERLFELIARHVDGAIPGGKTWHRDLLQRMAKDMAGVRPAVLSKDTAVVLDEFRRFRYLVRNVYQDQKSLPQVHEGLRFLPQRLRIGRISGKQSGEGIVGRGFLPFRWTPRCFRAGKNFLGGDEKVDVAQVVALRWIHGLSPPIDRLSLGCYNDNAERSAQSTA